MDEPLYNIDIFIQNPPYQKAIYSLRFSNIILIFQRYVLNAVVLMAIYKQ